MTKIIFKLKATVSQFGSKTYNMLHNTQIKQPHKICAVIIKYILKFLYATEICIANFNYNIKLL